MDIKHRKPRVVNLRRKKKELSTLPEMSDDTTKEINNPSDISETVVPLTLPVMSGEAKLEKAGPFPCVKCKSPTASRELGRCETCETEHKMLCRQLDSKPKQIIEKAPTDWIVKKEVKQGVLVSTYMTRAEAQMMGIKVD